MVASFGELKGVRLQPYSQDLESGEAFAYLNRDGASLPEQASIANSDVFLRRACQVRTQRRLDFDDLMILISCNLINVRFRERNAIVVQPANVASIADNIEMSRETVRRRLHTMESSGAVQRYPSGYVVSPSAQSWLFDLFRFELR